ncbi:hypothetical protein M569_11727, partial [Genlisea aurea]
MLCETHPYRNSTPGGICAFCLQEKLGKLVSSSFPVAVFPSSSSSSASPSFRSDGLAGGKAAPPERRAKLPFLLIRMKNKKEKDSAAIVFKRSKSAAAMGFLDENYVEDCGRRRFWSFLQMHRCARKPPPPPIRSKAADGDDERRRVSRSRSVGCGSRTFSGDFFERISTGFGDCTLRRAESQRENAPPRPKHAERVKCGGLFSMMTSSSSSSSSSASSYW